MVDLILLRHGESEWNQQNRFTGWVDIPLSRKGIDEALRAGEALAHLPIDRIYTSTLVRGSMTALLAMSVHRSGRVAVMQPQDPKTAARAVCYDSETENHLIPVISAWQLNERDYGELQGKKKEAMRTLYGEEQIALWRRSYSEAPPGGESLKDTAARTLPYFKEEIVPQLENGKKVLISAHGNSLRALVMFLEQLSPSEVVRLEIPTGKALFYRFDSVLGYKKCI